VSQVAAIRKVAPPRAQVDVVALEVAVDVYQQGDHEAEEHLPKVLAAHLCQLLSGHA
jgi:hypothetical protein